MSFCPLLFTVMLWHDVSSSDLSTSVSTKQQEEKTHAQKTLFFFYQHLMDCCLMHCVPAAPLFARKPVCIYPHFLHHTLQNNTTALFSLIFLYQYIFNFRPLKLLQCKPSETILQSMVMQCFMRPRLLPQECAFACNCWFAFPYFTSFVVSEEHTPMWSSLLCLSMIRHLCDDLLL